MIKLNPIVSVYILILKTNLCKRKSVYVETAGITFTINAITIIKH